MTFQTSKAINLGILREKFPQFVPPFIVVCTEDFLSACEKKQYSGLKSVTEKIQFISELSISNKCKNIIEHLHKEKITPDNRIAIRTSAYGEDGNRLSFAGMYETFLDITVALESLENALLDSWLSLFSQRVLNYQGLHETTGKNHCEIILQRMVMPLYSGVLFSEPLKIDDSLLNIQQGNAAVVKGASASQFTLGQFSVNYPKQAQILKDVVQKLGLVHKQSRLDIEFGFTENEFFLFQVRPVTRIVSKEFNHSIWDKSNIGENYPGITLPLTYSFIRQAYSKVYPSFLKLIGIATDLREQSVLFDNMLGYIRGQVYYNLTNWYELIDLLPWQPHIRSFYDNMLQPVKPIPSTKLTKKSNWQNFRASIKLICLFLSPKGKIQKPFMKRLSQLTSEFKQSFGPGASVFELNKLFLTLSSQFFSVWGLTIVNDVRVMVFFGLYTRFVTAWCSNNTEMINQLAVAKNPASITLLHSLETTAQAINDDLPLAKLLRKATYDGAVHYIAEFPKHLSSRAIQCYLENYGVRFANELKLETVSMKTELKSFLKLMTSYIDKHWKITTDDPSDILYQIPRSIFSWSKKIVLNFFRVQTTKAITMREQFRLERARVFDMARSIFLQIGSVLKETDLLENERDIFYLTIEEINNSANFHNTPRSLKIIVEERRRLVESYEKESLPRRIDSYGILQDDNLVGYTQHSSSRRLEGLGTSSYVVEACEVIVMKELDVSVNVNGKVLVVPQTDPGWTVLFPLIKGIITEEGNTLSHASIIARELRIPCVAKIKRATELLKNGDKVTVNGITGEVIIL